MTMLKEELLDFIDRIIPNNAIADLTQSVTRPVSNSFYCDPGFAKEVNVSMNKGQIIIDYKWTVGNI